VPYWAEDISLQSHMINARGETVTEKPAFRQAFRQRRCLVPADGFYEWPTVGAKSKQPFLFRRQDKVPFAFAALGVKGTDVYAQVDVPVIADRLALLLACTACGGVLFGLLRVPNAWMLGPLAVAIALTASGVAWSSMPTVLTNAGQLLMGCALGSRFERDFMRRSPRFVGVVAISIVIAIVCSALFAVLLARISLVPLPSLVLATAPGGIGEMCITAKVLQLGVPLVTAAHVTRVVMLVTTTAPVFRLLRVALGRRRS